MPQLLPQEAAASPQHLSASQPRAGQAFPAPEEEAL